jgi:predicted Zn-dependent protease
MDANICENCSLYLPIWKKVCPNCHQSIMLDSASRISIWRLGDIRDGVVGHIARNLRATFGMNVVIQPGYLDPRPSSRPRWRGLSANVFLRQVYRRHLRGTAVSIGMTESNIVPDQNHNFLFGYAYLSLPSAVISLHQMSVDHPSLERLAARASAIAVHEIGHTFHVSLLVGTTHIDRQRGQVVVGTQVQVVWVVGPLAGVDLVGGRAAVVGGNVLWCFA